MTKYLILIAALAVIITSCTGCGKPIGDASASKEREAYQWQSRTYVGDSMYRYENEETTCYGGYRTGLSCKFK